MIYSNFPPLLRGRGWMARAWLSLVEIYRSFTPAVAAMLGLLEFPCFFLLGYHMRELPVGDLVWSFHTMHFNWMSRLSGVSDLPSTSKDDTLWGDPRCYPKRKDPKPTGRRLEFFSWVNLQDPNIWFDISNFKRFLYCSFDWLLVKLAWSPFPVRSPKGLTSPNLRNSSVLGGGRIRKLNLVSWSWIMDDCMN